MVHINAYWLAELNAGAREFTDRVYHWEQSFAKSETEWEYVATTADTPGDTAVRIRRSGYFKQLVVVTTPYIAGREFHRETPAHVLMEAMGDYHESKTALEIGRLLGVTDRLIAGHWHPDQWQRCSGVYTCGVRIVQKHLVPPGHAAMTTGGKCKNCLKAYRYIRRQIGSVAAGSTLPTMYDGVMPGQISRAHGVAYQYPIKPYTVYRADWRKGERK